MAVAFDAKTATWTIKSPAGTSMTLTNLTVGSGTNRALVCGIWFDTGTIPTGITAVWDSGGTNQSMTQIASAVISSDGVSSITGALYGLVAPTSGNKNLLISWTGSNVAGGFAVSFTGVDQTSAAVAFPHGANNHASSASPATITITSATGNLAMAMHAQGLSVWGTISGTLIASEVGGPTNAWTANYDTGAATVTLTAAFTGTGPWDSIGTDIKAAAAGGGAQNQNPQFNNPTLRPNYHQYWLEANTYLISKDSTLAGKQSYLLPPIGGTSNPYYIRTVNLELLSKDSQLAGKQSFNLPPIGGTSNPYWFGNLNPPAFPTVTRRTEVPYGPPPNPYWIDTLSPPAFPTVQQRVELPLGPPPSPFWIKFTLPFNYPAPGPPASNVWFVPLGPPPNQYWIDYTIPAGQDLLPENQYNWPVPKGPTSNPSYVSYIIPVGQDALPTRQQDWKVPASPIRVQDWQQGFNNNLNIVVVAVPNVGYVWFVPSGPQQPPISQFPYIQPPSFPSVSDTVYFVPAGPPPNPSFTSYIIPAGQDQLPAGKQIWTVPGSPVPPTLTWLLSPAVPPPFVPTTPTNQYNWPNPILRIPSDFYNWIYFLTNIPPPPPPPPEGTPSGRYDEDYFTWKKWREGKELLRKRLAAQTLGRHGGIASGKSRRTR